MEKFGGQTITVLLHTENHKTTIEVVSAAVLEKGQPVKLDATGKAVAWAKADGKYALIGIAYADCKVGDNITIWSRGYAIVHGVSNAATACGPVTYEGLQASGTYTGLSKYGVAVNTQLDHVGWLLDQAAGAGELVRVLIAD